MLCEGTVSEECCVIVCVCVCVCVCTHTIQLTAVEMDFLATHTSQALSAFQEVGKGGGGSERLLAMAGSQVESAAKQ